MTTLDTPKAEPYYQRDRDEIKRLKATVAELVAALEEWQRLNNTKGLDPSIRRKMKLQAANLSHAALAKAKE